MLGTMDALPTATSSGLIAQGVNFAYRRGRTTAIDEPGGIVFPMGRTALLGPNGAGKSTLLAIVAGALEPRSGRVMAAGRRLARRDRMEQVAWLPQHPTIDRGLTSLEYCAFQAWLTGVSHRRALSDGREALDLVGLGEHADHRTHTLSGGLRARLAIAGTLVAGSRYLVLDEPLAALDPAQRRMLVELLAGLASGRVIVVSTHDVLDLRAGFDSVVVLREGRCIFQGGLDEFLRDGDGREVSATDAYVRILGVNEE